MTRASPGLGLHRESVKLKRYIVNIVGESLASGSFTLLSVLTFIAAFVSIRFLTPISRKIGLVDKPDHRKLHEGAVPLIGGISVFFAYVLVTLIAFPITDKLASLLLGSALVFVLGVWDDMRPISVRVRLLIQVFACGIVYIGTDLSITKLGVVVPFGAVELSVFAPFFTVMAVIGLMNAYNFMDGIDGLSGTLALVAIVGILAFESQGGSIRFLSYLVFLAIALIPYLIHNLGLVKNKVFLGDAGSMFVGFTIAWTLINQTQVGTTSMSPTAALWCVAVPVIDTLGVMIRRVRKGQSPFLPDRDHLHHILMRAGFSSRGALIIITGFATSILSLGMVLERVLPTYSFYGFLFCVLVYVYALLHAWKLQRALKR